MRLTLRTLLAYLDGILDPSDAEELGKKIEESEYAAELVNRIRDVMRRLRLGAPSLTERGPGLDPNTVAEYLDNTLASERVTDFEKVCLDSDIHLAEVASSHQILTLVLGEPAEVDPNSRQRIYRLPENEGKPMPPPTPAAHPSPAMPDSSAAPRLELEPRGADEHDRKPRQKPTVPEYLREPLKKSSWPVAVVAALLAVCVVGVVFMALGQFEPESTFGKYLVKIGLISASPELAKVENTPSVTQGEKPGENGDGETTPPGTADEPVQPADQTPPAAPEGDAAAAQPGGQNADKSPGEKVETPPGAVPPATPGTAEPATPSTAEPSAPGGEEKAGTEKQPELPLPGNLPPPPPPPPETLGRLMSSEQVLLGNGSGGWTRLATNQTLVSQDVLALPTYRAKIALTMGVSLEVLDGTRVSLLPGDAKQQPGVRVLYGRVVLMPLGKVGSRMRLAFGDRDGTVTFTNPETTIALDVRRLRAPGANPEFGPANYIADLYVAAGGVSWQETLDETASAPVQLAAGQRLSFDANLTSAPANVKEPPPWIETSSISALDRRASAAIAEALSTDRLARVGLMELSISRPQKEVKWLALRCLGHVGQFDDVVVSLNDPAFKLVWSDYVEELRSAVGRDVETAAAARAALEKQYPQQAADMYRMLWGYGDKDLRGGTDAALVKGLDDELLAVRVLSYWNLKDITGQGAAYQPEQTASRRQQSVRRWRQRLDAKEIRYQTGEEKPVEELKEKATTPHAGKE